MPDPIEHREARERLVRDIEDAEVWRQEATAACLEANDELSRARRATGAFAAALAEFDRTHPGIEQEETG